MKIKTFLASAILALTLGGSANAAIVGDGDFSNPPGGSQFTTYNAVSLIGPWIVTTGSVDLIGGYWQAPGGVGGSVDLDGTAPGGIAQSLNLTPGSYVLNFSLSGNPDGGNPTKTVQVSIGGISQNFTYVTGTNSHSDMQYVTESMDFTIPGPGAKNTLLSFLSLDDPSSAYGAVIGNVSVAAVPLPASVGLFALALCAMGYAGYRRRSAM